MMREDLVVAQYANTRGSRVNDPDLERYLRDEYPGGMTVEALLAGTVPPNGGVRGAFFPFLKAVFRGFDPPQPSAPPMGPPVRPRPRGGAPEASNGPGGSPDG